MAAGHLNNRTQLMHISSAASLNVDAARAVADATCRRCLQIHTGEWWSCTQKPASRKDRIQFINKSDVDHKTTDDLQTPVVPLPQLDAAVANSGPYKRRPAGPVHGRHQRRAQMVRKRDTQTDDICPAILADAPLSPTEVADVAAAKGLHFSTGEEYHDVDEMLTMDDIIGQADTPFTIKTVTKRRVKKGKRAALAKAVDSKTEEGGNGDEAAEYDFVDEAEGDDDFDVLSVVDWHDLEHLERVD